MKFLSKGNWGLRLLALILAIIIYHALKIQSDTFDNNHDRHTLQHR